jgi:hypothetical protein
VSGVRLGVLVLKKKWGKLGLSVRAGGVIWIITVSDKLLRMKFWRIN